MAARSTGLFPREGFNLDNAFEVTTSPVVAPVTIALIRTLRVIIVNAREVAATGDGAPGVFGYSIAGTQYLFTINDFLAKLDANGTYIAHHRGFGKDGDSNICDYEITPGADNTGTGQSLTFDGMFIELADGPAR